MSRLAKSFALFLSLAGLLLGATNASAAACTNVATGTWSVAGTWAAPCNVAGGPTAADTVTIINNTTVTVNNAGMAASSVTINTGASASTLTFAPGSSLAVTNNVVVNLPTGAVTKRITVLTGTLTVGGNVTLNGGTANTRDALLSVSSGLITINGGLIINATVATSSTASITAAGGRITVNGAAGVANGDVVSVGVGTFSVTNAAATFNNTSATNLASTTVSTGALNITGNLTNAAAETMTVSSTGNITVGGTLNNNGTITLTTTGTVNANGVFTNSATGIFTNTAAGNLNIGGNATQSGTFNRGTGTVTFNGAAAQTLGGVVTTFNNLIVANTGAGTTTLLVNASVVGNLSVNSGTFDLSTFTANRTAAGGTLTVANGATLKIGGANPFPTNYTAPHTLGATSTVEYSGTTQNVLNEGAPGYGNLTLSGSLTKTALGSFTVRGDLAITGVTFASVATIQTVNGNVSNTGTHTATSGSITLSGGAAAHALSGNGAYANLILNDTLGATLSGSPTVSGTLTLTTGTITTGANTLITAAACNAPSVARTSGWVNGNLQKAIPAGPSTCNFEVGDATNYTPVSTTFAATTTAGNLTAKTTAGDHPSIASSGIDSAAGVNRYWTLTNGGVGGLGTGYSATFNFINPGDIDAGANTANFQVENWSGAAWSATTAGTRNLTNTTATGLTAFGDFAVGEKKPPPTVVSINRANADPTTAASVSWTVTFSRSVTGVDAPAFALAASGLSGAYIATVTGIGTTWTVTASTGIGAGTLGLNQIGPGSVSPALSGTFTGQVYTITATPPLVEYRMDQGSWNGTANEVVDSSGSGLHAVAVNAASTIGGSNSEAIPGNPGTCRYGVFDNASTITQGYVLTPLPDLTTDFTVTAWIRTTDDTVPAQRILIDDQGTGPATGYGISLGDGGAGKIRFYSRGITPAIFDSAYAIAKDTWYFVGVVADITNKKRTIYVFDTAGTLLNSTTEAAWTAGAWGTDAGPVSIGAETNASIETPAANHFKGNLDEVRVYQQALSPAAVTAIATQTHACAVVNAAPNHYELSLPTSSVACLPTTVTVTACTDATSPCTNPFAAASGTTASLATSGGTLGATSVTFGATGIASTTLNYPLAPDATGVSVTLSGELIAITNPRQCCPNGTSPCVAANSCSTTFNTAAFIFSAAAGGGVPIPTQVAGITSVANYLRAVKTNTTTQACEAALAGTSAVNFAYECNNPATCYTSDLMSVNGGTATTIARNNNGSVASYLPVNMTFDANGNAPFTFNYSDAGQVKLWASKTASGALLSTLTGSSNSFVVKPHHFDITNIACTTVGAGTCAPANGTGNNPAASGAAGAAFIQAGQPFKATVTAMNGAATPAFTPNFGKETTAEGAELTSFNHLPGLGGATAISRVLSGFNSGAATRTDLAWNEVGVLQLQATLSNANGYLGSDSVNGKNSVVSAVNPYVGRFIPDHFDTVVTPQGGGFAYSGNPVGPVPGQPFTVTVTAKNASASPTANYYNAGGYARNVNLSVPVGGATGQLYVDAVAGGTGAVPAAKFLNVNPGEGKVNYSDATGRISFVFNSLPNAEQAIQIHAEDADTVTSSGANGNINIRHGRLRVFNAFGSEKADLSLPLRAEYWTGNSWVLNSADSFTVIPAGSIALSGYSGTLSAVNLGASHVTGTTLAGGQGSIVLTMPTPTATGSVDLAINLGAGAADQSCLATHPATTGAAIPWLRSIYGNCAVTYDRDPSARGSFGIYAPETKRTIHVRELF